MAQLHISDDLSTHHPNSSKTSNKKSEKEQKSEKFSQKSKKCKKKSRAGFLLVVFCLGCGRARRLHKMKLFKSVLHVMSVRQSSPRAESEPIYTNKQKAAQSGRSWKIRSESGRRMADHQRLLAWDLVTSDLATKVVWFLAYGVLYVVGRFLEMPFDEGFPARPGWTMLDRFIGKVKKLRKRQRQLFCSSSLLVLQWSKYFQNIC